MTSREIARLLAPGGRMGLREPLEPWRGRLPRTDVRSPWPRLTRPCENCWPNACCARTSLRKRSDAPWRSWRRRADRRAGRPAVWACDANAAKLKDLANLVETATRGGAVPAILEALNRTDEARQAVDRELAELEKTGSRTDPVFGDLRCELGALLDDWHELLTANAGEARPVLQATLADRIACEPTDGKSSCAINDYA